MLRLLILIFTFSMSTVLLAESKPQERGKWWGKGYELDEEKEPTEEDMNPSEITEEPKDNLPPGDPDPEFSEEENKDPVFDEFENIFRKSFYKDKTDAIEYAKEKKKIKNQGNKELPLVNN